MRGYPNATGPSDEAFAATLAAMDDAPRLTRVQLVQAHALASEQVAECLMNARDAELAGYSASAAGWDMEAERARQRQRAAWLALHGPASERLVERVVSVRVLDVAARKRCKVAFRIHAEIEAERTGAW